MTDHLPRIMSLVIPFILIYLYIPEIIECLLRITVLNAYKDKLLGKQSFRRLNNLVFLIEKELTIAIKGLVNLH